MSCTKQGVVNWPQLGKDEIFSLLNEIKINKLLDIKWKNPGKIDPQTYETFHEKKNQLTTDTETSNQLVKDDASSNDSAQPVNDMFDLFDEFNTETEKDDEIFNLQLTHTKRTTDKKVACMDKILDDMRKKFDTEQNIMNDSEPSEADKMSNEQQSSINTNIEIVQNKESNSDTKKESVDSSDAKESTETKSAVITDAEESNVTKQGDPFDNKEPTEVKSSDLSDTKESTEMNYVDISEIEMSESADIKQTCTFNTNESTEVKIDISSDFQMKELTEFNNESNTIKQANSTDIKEPNDTEMKEITFESEIDSNSAIKNIEPNQDVTSKETEKAEEPKLSMGEVFMKESVQNEPLSLQAQDTIIQTNLSTVEETVHNMLMDLLNVNFPY